MSRDNNKYLSPEEKANQLKTTVATLANWRSQGKQPPYTKINGSVLYFVDDDLPVYKSTDEHRVLKKFAVKED